jgi:hypothetical protein
MLSYADSSSFIRQVSSRNEQLKQQYQTINSCLKHIASKESGITGIAVREDLSDVYISVVDQEYLFKYSPHIKDSIIMGSINVYYICGEDKKHLIQSIEFTGAGEVRYPISEQQDPVFLDDDITVIAMLLDIIANAINYNKC